MTFGHVIIVLAPTVGAALIVATLKVLLFGLGITIFERSISQALARFEPYHEVSIPLSVGAVLVFIATLTRCVQLAVQLGNRTGLLFLVLRTINHMSAVISVVGFMGFIMLVVLYPADYPTERGEHLHNIGSYIYFGASVFYGWIHIIVLLGMCNVFCSRLGSEKDVVIAPTTTKDSPSPRDVEHQLGGIPSDNDEKPHGCVSKRYNGLLLAISTFLMLSAGIATTVFTVWYAFNLKDCSYNDCTYEYEWYAVIFAAVYVSLFSVLFYLNNPLIELQVVQRRLLDTLVACSRGGYSHHGSGTTRAHRTWSASTTDESQGSYNTNDAMNGNGDCFRRENTFELTVKNDPVDCRYNCCE